MRGIVQGVQIRGERDCTGCADKGLIGVRGIVQGVQIRGEWV